jgi:predicted nucleic acid-binding protein
MNLVLDSNIFISGLITPNGTISKLILRDLKDSILICP